MTHPRAPEGGEFADVMDIDAEIEALRGGGRRSEDPVLNLIAGLRDDIDSRTAFLLGQTGQADSRVLPDAAPTSELGKRSWDTESAAARSRRRRRRLVVLPAAGILVLGSTGVAAALSGSRQAPLYELNQLIFGSDPSSDGQINRDLVDAGKLLDRAAALRFDQRTGSLSAARVLLSQARKLLPAVSSPTVRTRLSQEITLTELRAGQLAQRPAPTVQPTPAPGPSTSVPTRSEPADEPSSGVDFEEPPAPSAVAADTGTQSEVQPLTVARSEPAEPSAPPAVLAPVPSGPIQPDSSEKQGSQSTAREPESDKSERPDN